ncbi:hypothetical protein Tpau_3159 [Tsukamurella paurometabola DSM 20162]|uniref:Uncharacterized protein n=1 Tax=Tsukamurella paurometabola (strain ATCC 8368 / DSM 20162 / CCUG 35730 / CIP 100753 / JCM 10117 / KCTC 9821 / NBRC 16120 / NCIMB 702349 / NCTC 13040) TaxID=521096 RepID=D5UV28_TSUPD|nr:hypothetical protein Tpau_3159 [Tsukamurella paurometabola DSM 20162]
MHDGRTMKIETVDGSESVVNFLTTEGGSLPLRADSII